MGLECERLWRELVAWRGRSRERAKTGAEPTLDHRAQRRARLSVVACLARASITPPAPALPLVSHSDFALTLSPSSSTSPPPAKTPQCPSHPSPESSGSASGLTSPPPLASVSAQATHSGQSYSLCCPSRVIRTHLPLTGMACTSSVVSIPSISQILPARLRTPAHPPS